LSSDYGKLSLSAQRIPDAAMIEGAATLFPSTPIATDCDQYSYAQRKNAVLPFRTENDRQSRHPSNP
jgi:hypothetical protein